MTLEIVFALLFGLNLGIVLMNIPPVLTELMGLYGTSYTEISVLMSALLWTHAAMQLPAGMKMLALCAPGGRDERPGA